MHLVILFEFLVNIYGQNVQNQTTNQNTRSKTLANEMDESIEVCPFYLRGHCKFGTKCFKRHIRPNQDKLDLEKDPSHVKYMYEVEIRFPVGCQYPAEPPLVAVTSINPLGKREETLFLVLEL